MSIPIKYCFKLNIYAIDQLLYKLNTVTVGESKNSISLETHKNIQGKKVDINDKMINLDLCLNYIIDFWMKIPQNNEKVLYKIT